MSSLHTGLIIASVALILLVTFLVQNARSVKISFLGANAHVSLAVALLIAALGGTVIVGGSAPPGSPSYGVTAVQPVRGTGTDTELGDEQPTVAPLAARLTVGVEQGTNRQRRGQGQSRRPRTGAANAVSSRG